MITFEWVVTVDYDSDCNSACGTEEYTQTRTIKCQNSLGEIVDDSNCTDPAIEAAKAGEKPAESRVCPSRPACRNEFVFTYINL